MNMKAWKVVAICLGVVATPFVTCCVWMTLPHAPSCPDRNLIKEGMTPDEVRRILGDPKKEDVRADSTWWYYDCGPFSRSSPIRVYFKPHGRVDYVFLVD